MFFFEYVVYVTWGTLALLIIAMIAMRKLMKKFSEAHKTNMIYGFESIREAFDEGMDALMEKTIALNREIKKDYKANLVEVKKVLNNVHKSMDEAVEEVHEKTEAHFESLQNLYDEVIKHIRKFTDSANKRITDQLAYMREVQGKLQGTLDSIESINKKLNKVSDTGLENYEKLELLSDKTKILMAEHEVTIDKHRSSFEEGIKSLSEIYAASASDLNSKFELKTSNILDDLEGEMKQKSTSVSSDIEKIKEEAMQSIELIANKNKEIIEELMTSNTVVNYVNDLRQITNEFQAASENNKAVSGVTIAKLDEKILELDKVIQANSKKRGLFG